MLSFILTAGLALSALSAGPTLPRYRLAVDIDPQTHRIAVRGRIEGRPCDAAHKLYLNQTFHLSSFRVAGRETPVRIDTAAPAAQWTVNARPLVFACRPGTIEFAYDGVVPDTVNDVNLIAPGLVELAGYTGWYPLDPSVSKLTYDIELTLPAEWVVASGGRVASARVSGGRRVTRFVSATPAMDIAFVASPALVLRSAHSGAATVEVYTVTTDSALAEGAIHNLQQALDLYGGWYGAPRTGPLPTRMVYSPRTGWGYSRLPLMVIPAAVARDWSRKPLGNASIFQGTAHELAHFWWQIADTKTTDDWLNEGGAEFSAFSAASRVFGAEIRDSLVAQYLRHAARTRTKAAISATPNESPDRYVNHYEKPALLFAAVERRTGQAALMTFLRGYYGAHIGRRDATTASFLADARATLGEDVAGLIERCVTAEWTEECAR